MMLRTFIRHRHDDPQTCNDWERETYVHARLPLTLHITGMGRTYTRSSFSRACVATQTSGWYRVRISVGVVHYGRQHARSIPTSRQNTQYTLRAWHILRYAAMPMDPETDWYLAHDLRSLVAKRETSFVNTDLRVLFWSVLRACTCRSIHSISWEGH